MAEATKKYKDFIAYLLIVVFYWFDGHNIRSNCHKMVPRFRSNIQPPYVLLNDLRATFPL